MEQSKKAIVEKYIQRSFDDFQKTYDDLKMDWMNDNIDSEEEDFAKFLRKIYTENENLVSEFTYKKISNFFNVQTSKHIDKIISNFHNQNKRENSTAELTPNVKTIFNNDLKQYNLFQYFVENFHSSDPRFSDLSKYNHIHKYFKEELNNNIEHKVYKEFVKQQYGFDYGSREIKGETQKHLNQLARLAISFESTL